MSSKPSTCTEESGAAPGFQSSGASADTQLASTTPPTGTCSSEANIDNPDLNLAANTDFTFYIVVDVKATAVLWNAVDFRVNQDRLEFNSGTWPPAAQSVSGTSPCPVAANTWNPAGSTTVGDPSVFSYSPSTQDFGGGATSCVVSYGVEACRGLDRVREAASKTSVRSAKRSVAPGTLATCGTNPSTSSCNSIGSGATAPMAATVPSGRRR